MKNKSYFRVVAIFALVLAIATSLWFASAAMPSYAQGGYGYGGGGGGAGIPYPGLTLLTGKISGTGVLYTDVTAPSADGLVQLTINKGTTALDKLGNPLSAIIMAEMTEPPAPPANANVIGLIYSFEPTGATFEPAASFTFTYDPADIPAGVSEDDLVLAYWDGDQWVMLPTTVNTAANTATAEIGHFTAFALLAQLPPAPDAFTVSGLTVSPAEADIGETVTITILVANTGDATGSYEVTLKVDEIVVATEEVTLAGGASQEVTFITVMDIAGTYTVDVNGLVGEFMVMVAPTPPAPPAPPAPPPPALPAPEANWWLIGSIIAAVVVIGGLLWYLLVARKGIA